LFDPRSGNVAAEALEHGADPRKYPFGPILGRVDAA
jgi:hypothetical protein